MRRHTDKPAKPCLGPAQWLLDPGPGALALALAFLAILCPGAAETPGGSPGTGSSVSATAHAAAETFIEEAEWDDVPPPPPRTRAVPGEFVVCFRETSVRGARLAGSSQGLGSGIASIRWLTRPGAGLQRPTLGDSVSVFDRLALVIAEANELGGDVLARLQGHPWLASAEPNTILTLADDTGAGRFPNDFRFGELWGLWSSASSGGSPGADIRAPEAWAMTTGGTGITVAVIDTGIDFFHPDLEANMWVNAGEIPGNGVDDDANGYPDDVHGYDFVSDDGDPMDDQIHGTHVAGTIGAVGNNEIGVAGVCWQTRLMALKAFDDRGEGSLFNVLAAMRYAVANGARVLNASWGQPDRSQALGDAVREAHERGTVVVASAGNSRSDVPSYPAAYPEPVTVAALNSRNQRSIFSSYGAHVDVGAPGENILSTVPDNRFDLASGTSMAAPHVAGVAALILVRHPEFSATQVGDILCNAVDPVSGTEYIGAGRLNAARAVRVDLPLPTARLEMPAIVAGRVEWRGTATSAHFLEYVLDYGQGVYPTQWIGVHAATSAVEGGVLLADWASDAVPEGTYVFRLTVRDTLGQEADERATVTIRNVHLTAPVHNDIVRMGDVVSVRGTVFGAGRTYTLAHGVGRRPSVWSTRGITLAGGGQAPVIDGLLGTWDTGELVANEFYTLQLTARAGEAIVGTWTATLIYVDARLRPGWPQHMVAPPGYGTNDWRQITVADLDRDGAQEIIAMEAGNDDGKTARLLVYGLDGTLRWAREVAPGIPTADLPSVGDIDGDGFGEVFVDAGQAGQIWAFRHDGQPLGPGWPASAGAFNLGKVLADLDQDGTPELVVCGTIAGKEPGGPRLLAVIDRLGETRQRWNLAGAASPLDMPRPFPAVADLDEDPDLEIVVVTGESGLALFDLDRPDGPVWQVSAAGSFYGSPVIGDLDGEGWPEVVVGSHDTAASGKAGTRGGVFVFDRWGQVRPGWPVLIDESFPATPALADLDGDGGLDIVAVNWEAKLIHVLRHDGFDLPGWPVGPVSANLSSSFPMTGWIKSMPVVGDVDGDGSPDVVLIAPGRLDQAATRGDVSFFGGVKAWSAGGQAIDLHPRAELTGLVMESSAGNRWKAAPPVLTDLDGNGLLDVVASTIEDKGYGGSVADNVGKGRSSLYAWELAAAHDPGSQPWPMYQRDLAHTGAVPTVKPLNQPPVMTSLPNQTIRTGGDFFPLELDRYVEDPDDPVTALTWSVEGAVSLRVRLQDHRIVIVEPPSADWEGAETLRFVVRDPGGLEATATATFAARADYLPPVATTDAGELDEDTDLVLDPIQNDSHPRHLPLQIVQVSRARFGEVQVLPDHRVRYQPAPDYFGEDSYTYLVGDGEGGMAMAWVNLQIRPLPDPPRAVEDRAITLEDTPVLIEVLANDSDPDGDALALADLTLPAHGTVEPGGAAGLQYRPQPGWSGADSFSYTVADGEGLEATGTVALQVKPVNDPPVALDMAFVLNRNTGQDLTYGAEDPDGDALTYRIVDGPQHGELWAQPTVATYYPKPGFAGEDTFTFVASDAEFTSAPARVRLTVLGVNNPPAAQSQTLVSKADRPLSLGLQATDADGEALTFEIVDPPLHGLLASSGSNVVYTPEAQYLGHDRFTFTASDGQATSPPALISLRLTDQNTAPIAESYLLSLPMNRPASVTLRGVDGENDPLAFTVVTNPAHGSLTGTASNWLFTPQPNYYGPDRFAFTVHDGELASAPGTVSVTIVHPNHPPATTNQSVIVERDRPSPIDLAVTDADADRLRGVILEGPLHGRLHGQGTRFVYTPDPGYSGIDSFTYRVWDGLAYSPSTAVGVSVQASLPERPPRFEALKLLEDGSLQMRIATMPGRRLEVLTSTNLESWELLLSVTPESDTVTHIDPSNPARPRRYYRAVRMDGDP